MPEPSNEIILPLISQTGACWRHAPIYRNDLSVSISNELHQLHDSFEWKPHFEKASVRENSLVCNEGGDVKTRRDLSGGREVFSGQTSVTLNPCSFPIVYLRVEESDSRLRRGDAAERLFSESRGRKAGHGEVGNDFTSQRDSQ